MDWATHASPHAPTEGPAGIHGWLALLAVGIVVSPLMYLYAAATGIQTLLDPAVWSMATDRSHEAFHALWLPALLLEAMAPALLLAASGYLTVLFFRKSRGFPRLYVAVAVGTLAYAWLDLFLGTLIPAAREQIEFVREVGRALGSTLASLAWIAYVVSSKRVKNTFVGAL